MNDNKLRYPVTNPVPKHNEHGKWIDYWHHELTFSIKYYIEHESRPAIEHVVRSTRMLHWHACKLRPGLRTGKGYDDK